MGEPVWGHREVARESMLEMGRPIAVSVGERQSGHLASGGAGVDTGEGVVNGKVLLEVPDHRAALRVLAVRVFR
jgi:hypothetical protein